MNDSTKQELIESLTGGAGALLKELLVHRNRVDMMEQKKDAEIELAQARAQARSGGGSEVTGLSREPQMMPADEGIEAGDPQMTATPSEVEEALDELIAEEMCSVCKEVLQGLKERPTHEQVRGIMEYGTFKENLDSGAGVEEMKEVLRETTVLQSVFREKFTGAAG